MTTKGKEKMDIVVVMGAYLPIRDKFDGYGGTERVGSLLTKGLVRRGHNVTLIAPEGSDAVATKHVSTGRPLWADGKVEIPIEAHKKAVNSILDKVYEHSKHADIVHGHIDEMLADPRLKSVRTVNTVHGDTASDNTKRLYIESNYKPIIFISKTQRERMTSINPADAYIVHNAVNLDEFKPSYDSHKYRPGDYIVYLARISEEKGMHVALDVAHATKTNIVTLYTMPDTPKDMDYYLKEVKPRIEKYKDEIKIIEKENAKRAVIASYLKGAMALIAPSGFPPSTWAEPFGLMAVEANASGTPAIVANKGGLAEIVEQGRNGFKCDTKEEMIGAVERIKEIAGTPEGIRLRVDSRNAVVERFSPEVMVKNYEKTYVKILENPLGSMSAFGGFLRNKVSGSGKNGGNTKNANVSNMAIMLGFAAMANATTLYDNILRISPITEGLIVVGLFAATLMHLKNANYKHNARAMPLAA
ncbi:MAG: glycosyltransferase [Candidatus Micrarchaeota archaeon]|nr:glycosyltransferase [Candidatus Micrarchaeota archaeon]